MISAYVSTLVFGGFYYLAEIPRLYLPTFGAFFLFVLFGILSFFSVSLVTLFRLSIVTALAAFLNQIFYTGGIASSGIIEFVIPPLLAFFYRPLSDRFVLMVVSAICLVAMWPLTEWGYTQNLLPELMQNAHALLCAVFVFSIVTIYTFLFRNALVIKNQKIGGVPPFFTYKKSKKGSKRYGILREIEKTRKSQSISLPFHV